MTSKEVLAFISNNLSYILANSFWKFLYFTCRSTKHRSQKFTEIKIVFTLKPQRIGIRLMQYIKHREKKIGEI